jgi:diguanylate cyclase (GGDEF)-like protein
MRAPAAPVTPPSSPSASDEAMAIRHRDPTRARALAEQALAACDDPAASRRVRATLGACLSVGSAGLPRGRELLAGVLEECGASGDARLACEVLNELAIGYASTSDFDAAREHGERALAEARRLGARAEEARALRVLGSIHSTTGEFGRALALLLEALEIHEQLRGEQPGELDDAGHWERGTLFGRIGVVYSNLDQWDSALAYHRIALESFRGRFPHRAARTLYRMGIAAQDRGDRDLAERCYAESLALHETDGHLQGRAVALMGVAGIAGERGDAATAEAGLLEAFAVLDADPVYRAFASDCLWMLADIRMAGGDAAAAVRHLEEALPRFDEAQRPDAHRAQLHERLYRAYRLLGDAALALAHHERFHAYLVTHLNERANARLAEMMTRFDTERALKERELSRLRNEALEREVAERREVEAALARAKEELEARNRELHALTIRDPLTGLYNRRHLDERLSEAFALARRTGQPLSAMICDVDDFKQINDSRSHAVGDAVLREIAGILRRHLRRSDVCARYGGEEFVVIFPGTSLEAAERAARKLWALVRGHAWDVVDAGLAVTISAGVAELAGEASHEKLLIEADRRLYAAKEEGKDRVVS